MRLLLDECVPRALKRELRGHEVRTVVEMGWSSQRNGALLALMVKNGYEGMVTVDRNIRFQQNVRASGIAVIVLEARTNRIQDLRPLVADLLAVLESVRPGEFVNVGTAPTPGGT